LKSFEIPPRRYSPPTAFEIIWKRFRKPPQVMFKEKRRIFQTGRDPKASCEEIKKIPERNTSRKKDDKIIMLRGLIWPKL
jgi:hypothetical protein